MSTHSEYTVFTTGSTRYNTETKKFDPAPPQRANCDGGSAPITTDRAVAQRWADNYQRAYIESVTLVVVERTVTDWSVPA